ncbi:hypothetical protein WALSEDRAFT_49592 [Wallemia mellicola CBS 633.66]|uniref:Uncharacterized protein n=1 Tax=Wallemia mellicola (strain ATCC MYA-4683 / CBS 633.66) TaxID=671144 RepID=I4Y519_WALMC|nr:hypothetical protein WALSEDRAFT_49592 [Wallemia mellicola CBS 633.66]EIM19061.1 hypothetical protein WALSEDRAFT_49592 [Wallemia mellicola CBS 633.66]|eukprot:XP_006960894.1 hypothetical protein WALSEDRAFT_49592 [Wallemia mellicola CBS 633.66]
MEFTTHFELHSQTTRLLESVSHDHSNLHQRREFHPLCQPIPRYLYAGYNRKHFLRLQCGCLKDNSF